MGENLVGSKIEEAGEKMVAGKGKMSGGRPKYFQLPSEEFHLDCSTLAIKLSLRF